MIADYITVLSDFIEDNGGATASQARAALDHLSDLLNEAWTSVVIDEPKDHELVLVKAVSTNQVPQSTVYWLAYLHYGNWRLQNGPVPSGWEITQWTLLPA